MINLPKVHFFLSDLFPNRIRDRLLQTFCSPLASGQLKGLMPQFQQEKTHELIRLNFSDQTEGEKQTNSDTDFNNKRKTMENFY